MQFASGGWWCAPFPFAVFTSASGPGNPSTPQPSTLNPQPSTLNPKPYTLNPQPYIPKPTPSNQELDEGAMKYCQDRDMIWIKEDQGSNAIFESYARQVCKREFC